MNTTFLGGAFCCAGLCAISETGSAVGSRGCACARRRSLSPLVPATGATGAPMQSPGNQVATRFHPGCTVAGATLIQPKIGGVAFCAALALPLQTASHFTPLQSKCSFFQKPTSKRSVSTPSVVEMHIEQALEKRTFYPSNHALDSSCKSLSFRLVPPFPACFHIPNNLSDKL